MADKELEVKISVGAKADENSAKKAASEIQDAVVDAVGNKGHIEVPVDIKTNIKGATNELKKAQDDVVKVIEKTSGKGFSSSVEDINELTEAFTQFRKLAGQEHKAGTKQYKNIRALVEDSLQSYVGTTETKSTKQKKSGKKQNTTNYTDLSTVSKDLIKSLLDPSLKKVDTNLKEINKNLEDAEKNLKKNTIDKTDLKLTSDTIKKSLDINNDTANETQSSIEDLESTNKTNYRQDLYESSREESSDRQEIAKLTEDVGTGFNTDAKANELIAKVGQTEDNISGGGRRWSAEVVGGGGGNRNRKNNNPPTLPIDNNTLSPLITLAQGLNWAVSRIMSNVEKLTEHITGSKAIEETALAIPREPEPSNIIATGQETLTKTLTPILEVFDITDNNKLQSNMRKRELDREYEALNSGEYAKREPKVNTTDVNTTSKIGDNFLNKLKNIFDTSGTSAAQRAMNMGAEERARETAARLEKYGQTRSGNLTDTGDIANISRRRSLWRGNRNSDIQQNVQLTPGLNSIDTNAILVELQKLIEKNMFSAQTGGGVLKNVVGAATLYAGQPSLEKTRAQAEGLNTVLADTRKKILELIAEIQGKEDTLRAEETMGNASFDSQGNWLSGTAEAKKTFIDMENLKDVLRSVLADAAAFDDTIKSCGGNMDEVVKKASFVSPELQKSNITLQNLSAGLDKNGKALKYQTRTAETLGYTFQLMARSVGQMFRNVLSMLNPFNLIKQAFSDFASYDTKWQRTMNVIKYNLRRIIQPFMEWLAQQLVNIIGLVNALLKGIGKVFGQNWDLFDQAAAATEQMEENLEASANASAGFDELHDISSESGTSSAADDLTGDIYTPQWTDLYESIESFGEKVGNVFQKIGDVIDWISGLSFWDWLIIAGAALVGWIALKALINLFSGKNPLQSVADGLSSLLKAVGVAAEIAAFALFVSTLTDFVECMKDASWGDIAKSLVTLGGALVELVAAMARFRCNN